MGLCKFDNKKMIVFGASSGIEYRRYVNGCQEQLLLDREI